MKNVADVFERGLADGRKRRRLGALDGDHLEARLLDVGPDGPVDVDGERGDDRDPARTERGQSGVVRFRGVADGNSDGFGKLTATRSEFGDAPRSRIGGQADGDCCRVAIHELARLLNQILRDPLPAQPEALHLVGDALRPQHLQLRLDHGVHGGRHHADDAARRKGVGHLFHAPWYRARKLLRFAQQRRGSEQFSREVVVQSLHAGDIDAVADNLVQLRLVTAIAVELPLPDAEGPVAFGDRDEAVGRHVAAAGQRSLDDVDSGGAVAGIEEDHTSRSASKWGVRRQEIVDKVLGGFATVGNDLPLARNQKFYNDAQPQREFDPDKAKWHLKQAGLDGIELTFHTSDGAFAGAVDMGVLMQQSLAEAGIDITVKREPADGYWSEVWMTDPWVASYYNGRPTADRMLTSQYGSGPKWDATYFNNAEFDALLTQARAAPDEAKWRELYFEAQRLLWEDGGVLVVAFVNILIAASDRMGHGGVGVSRRLDDARLARRWWFEA